MRDMKLLQVGVELAQLLTTSHQFVRFDIPSSVDIDCARPSWCQACWLSRANIGTEMQGSCV